MSLEANGNSTANVKATVLETMGWMDQELASAMLMGEIQLLEGTEIPDAGKSILVTDDNERYSVDFDFLSGSGISAGEAADAIDGAGVYHVGRDGEMRNAESLQGLTAAQFDNQCIKNVGDAVAGVNENQTSITATIVRSLKG